MDKKENKTIQKRTFNGIVVTTGMNKTISVLVEAKKMHAKYKKQYKTSKKYHVHDEKEIAKIGDKVKFIECRPFSKTKRWRLLEIVK